MIGIQAMCMQATDGFCERIGVADEKDTATVWVLSRREVRMLNALIRTEKEKGSLDVLSRPQLTCSDNQTATVQVGEDVQVPVNVSVETKEKDGTTISQTKMATCTVGSIIRVTPRGLPDGTILLDVQFHRTTLHPTPVDLGNGTTTPAFNIQSVKVSVLVTDGGTALIRGGRVPSADGKNKHELIWLLTPQILKAPPLATPNHPAPVPHLSAPQPGAVPTIKVTYYKTPAVIPAPKPVEPPPPPMGAVPLPPVPAKVPPTALPTTACTEWSHPCSRFTASEMPSLMSS
jgi:hypothetical protein